MRNHPVGTRGVPPELKIQRSTLATCTQAEGLVVVIDVLRAFTTTAYAFAAGAREILLVRSVEEAFALRNRMPDALLMGEVDGLPVQGFDLSNSPSQLNGTDLHNRRLIQRTSNGTQGMTLSHRAEVLLASSFVCAKATALHILTLKPAQVTFVITGADAQQRFDGSPICEGDEDAACADYLEALLKGEKPDPQPFLQRVWNSPTGKVFADPARPEFPNHDLVLSTQVDRFNFAMRALRTDGLLVMKAIHT